MSRLPETRPLACSSRRGWLQGLSRSALLVGLGVDELSMSASDLGTIKALLRRQSLSDLQALARKALEAETVQEVRALGAALKSASSPTAGDAA